MEEMKLEEKLKSIKTQINTERQVNEQIVTYYKAKNREYIDDANAVEKKKDDTLNDLKEQTDQIIEDKNADEGKCIQIRAECKQLQLAKEK